jgi:hypothetical protein
MASCRRWIGDVRVEERGDESVAAAGAYASRRSGRAALGSRPSRPQRDLGLRRREPDVRLRTGWARLSPFCKERHTPRHSWVRLCRLDALSGQLFVEMFLYQIVFMSRSDSFCINEFGTFFWELYCPFGS